MKNDSAIREIPGTVKTLTVQYNQYGPNDQLIKQVPYAKACMGLVENPYTGTVDVAVAPYVKSEDGEYELLYTLAEDIKFSEYRKMARICKQCRKEGKPIPKDIDEAEIAAFLKDMMERKTYGNQQANAIVAKKIGDKSVETDFCLAPWRMSITGSQDAANLKAEYEARKKSQN